MDSGEKMHVSLFGKGSLADEYLSDPDAFRERVHREAEEAADRWLEGQIARNAEARRANLSNRWRLILGKLAVWRRWSQADEGTGPEGEP
jgi:hypothetical protein